eukprot:CAMPEP_0113697506 /NCGR_PEP_ID=MMETSP0038_2-20120614/22174_1 /TAXON_ID=2898 /ORGANISM="Cryptomonas paramecium" /LENGTH=151 /DNA_ID=CAMNT_0000620529 /DNA_START=192 /DNA_END=643 /DNA_ORIENTATION=+ /assembly_acc=CAM_ASM_000170
MEALQACTFAALQASWDATGSPPAFWRPSQYSTQSVQFLLHVPGGWECRRTLLNVLRVSWLDVLEQFGWTVRSAWNPEKPPALPLPEPGSDGKDTSTTVEFRGECSSFLLAKGETASKLPGAPPSQVVVHTDSAGSSDGGGAERSSGTDEG